MIPGVTTHLRQSWQNPAYPISGPPALQDRIDTAVIHYTSSARIPSDIDGFHRAMQRDYVVNRGYSLGYRWSVSQAGEAWEIRGWDFKSAANSSHNEHTEPILMLVDGNGIATDAAIHAARCIIAESQRRSGRTFAITGHGQLSGAATSCPGVGLRAQITAGMFVPLPDPIAPPPPGDDMRPIITTWSGEPWTILVGFDAVASTYTWRGIPGDQVATLIANGAATDGTATPWPAEWKSQPWMVRLG